MKTTNHNLNIGGTDDDWMVYSMLVDQDDHFSKNDNAITARVDGSKYNLLQKSSKHLKDSNMGYWYHFKHSISNGNRLLVLVLSSYIHAIVPGKLKQHAARGVINMYEDMKKWPHLRKAMYEISNERKVNKEK